MAGRDCAVGNVDTGQWLCFHLIVKDGALSPDKWLTDRARAATRDEFVTNCLESQSFFSTWGFVWVYGVGLLTDFFSFYVSSFTAIVIEPGFYLTARSEVYCFLLSIRLFWSFSGNDI